MIVLVKWTHFFRLSGKEIGQLNWDKGSKIQQEQQNKSKCRNVVTFRTVLVIGLTVADNWTNGKYPRNCLTTWNCENTLLTEGHRVCLKPKPVKDDLPFLQVHNESKLQYLSLASLVNDPNQLPFLQASSISDTPVLN